MLGGWIRNIRIVIGCLIRNRRSWKRYILFSVLVVGLAHGSEDQPNFPSDLESHPSPYLREHADDPIHWRDLKRSALQSALSLGRPILISSGYLSCYWCYRMKQDTFSDLELAELVNSNFMPILIDRELNPTEDQFLQDFMLSYQGFSGWPVTVILTPSGDPVFGYGFVDSASLTKSLNKFLELWRTSSMQISQQARLETAKRMQTVGAEDKPWIGGDAVDLVSAFLDQANASADTDYGGFGQAEKYPFIPQMLALLDLNAINPDPKLSSFITLTLDNILSGGLIDKVEGGVFRYSEQRDWGAPHFEQMLYTQAMMAKLLLRAARSYDSDKYQEAGLRIIDNMIARMGTEEGWYVSSLSAFGSSGKDGGYYTWDSTSLNDLLGDQWQAQIVDLLPHADEVLPSPIGADKDLIVQKLKVDRESRALQRDTKILLGLNGLALSALVAGASVREGLIEPARRLAERIISQASIEPLPHFGDQADISGADLRTYVYVAAGLFDWWQLSAQEGVLDLVAMLLLRAKDQFFDNDRWRSDDGPLLGSSQSYIAIQDSQLPSPSGEWYRLASTLMLIKIKNSQEFEQHLNQVESVWSVSMRDQAFFHGTIIAATMMRKWLKGSSYGTLTPRAFNSQ